MISSIAKQTTSSDHPRSTLILVRFPSSQLMQAIQPLAGSPHGRATISLSHTIESGASRISLPSITVTAPASDKQHRKLSGQYCRQGAVIVEAHMRYIVFIVDAPSDSSNLEISLATGPLQRLEGNLHLQLANVTRSWTDLEVLLQNPEDLHQITNFHLQASLFPRSRISEKILGGLSGGCFLETSSPDCNNCMTDNCARFCSRCNLSLLLRFLSSDSPFKQARMCQSDLLLIPRAGNWLDELQDSCELHVGILCSDAQQVKEFNETGVRCTSGSDRIWNDCLPLKLTGDLPAELTATWVRLFAEFASKPEEDTYEWTAKTYQSDLRNCFDFALEFLHQFDDATDGSLFGSSGGRLSKLDFCRRYILPRTREAASFIEMYHKIWSNKHDPPQR